MPLITAVDDDVWGLRAPAGKRPGEKEGTRRGRHETGGSRVAIKRQSPLCCASGGSAGFPRPRACDKPQRECAEPTFTTAGTSRASLLNPVSNGYQHRASNVSRPAALPHHCAGRPCARARAPPPCSRGAGRGEARAGLPLPRAPRQRDSRPAGVTGRRRETRTALAAAAQGSAKAPQRPQREAVLRDSQVSGLAAVAPRGCGGCHGEGGVCLVMHTYR